MGKKPDYKLLDGTLVPGVTTIKNEWNVEAFKWWGNKIGKQGKDLKEELDYTANIGTILHILGASSFKQTGGKIIEGYSEDEIIKGHECFDKLVKIKDEYKFEPILVEHAFVSEVFKYGGTPDYFGPIDGINTLGDLKSSETMYPSMLLQLGGYYMLLKEHKYLVERGAIINCPPGKKRGKITFVSIPTLEVGFEIFLNCLKIYELKRKLK
jgi:hypothetical protein